MQKVMLLLYQMITFLAPQLKSKDSKLDIKETKEALIGINEVSLCLAEKFKDGVQVTDFTELYAKITSDEAFKEKVKAAYDNYKAIPEEVKDVDAGEALELAAIQLDYAPKFIEVFAKDDSK
jgi:hypothetical protein